jgi:hypothetical protein
MEKMTKTRKYNDKIYTFYRSCNTKTDASHALKVLREKGWNARIHEYKDLNNRIGVAFAIYRRRAKPVKAFNIDVKVRKPRKRKNYTIIRRRSRQI